MIFISTHNVIRRKLLNHISRYMKLLILLGNIFKYFRPCETPLRINYVVRIMLSPQGNKTRNEVL